MRLVRYIAARFLEARAKRAFRKSQKLKRAALRFFPDL